MSTNIQTAPYSLVKPSQITVRIVVQIRPYESGHFEAVQPIGEGQDPVLMAEQVIAYAQEQANKMRPPAPPPDPYDPNLY